MTKDEWKRRIKRACKQTGVYKKCFDDVIDTLAGILEKRDEAERQYIVSGSRPIVSHTNKGGATNLVKNPMLVMWDDLNKSALAYWRDLGLTPAGLKKLGEPIVEEKSGGLADVLAKLG